MGKRYWALISAVIAAIIIGTSTLKAAPSASFIGIGDLPGGLFESYALAISADGSVVVGFSDTESTVELLAEAFRWTRAEGMVGLGFLPDSSDVSAAFDISADGSVIVGSTGDEAWRWTQAGGLVGLGDLPEGGFDSWAAAASADGSVVVGTGDSEATYEEAFRWTQAEGMIGLGSLADASVNDSFNSEATGVSADGSVVVGLIDPEGGGPISVSGQRAFRWTLTDGMSLLSDPTDNARSMATDVSADGSVVVGKRATAFGLNVFRWTQADGMVIVGELAGENFGNSWVSVSADGAVVVGGSLDESVADTSAFIWDATNGMRRLQDIFTDEFGLDLTGWRLGVATGISADHLTFIGTGINPEGNLEGWIAHL